MNAQSRPLLPRVRPRTLLAAAGILAAAAAGLHLALPSRARAADTEAPSAPPAPKVTVAAVEQHLVTEYAELTGRVEARETVELRARVAGHLESIHFQAGQIVNEGDVLFRIDPRWHQAQFELASARADVASREAVRAETLLAAAAISGEETEARRAAAAEARAALATARLDLEHTVVRAPITGRIGRALVTPGNLVAGHAGGGTLLATIVATGDAYVYADLDEATFLKFNRLVREGRLLRHHGRIPVELQLADEAGFPRRGFLESADNRLDPGTGSLTLRLLFPNEDGALLPGLFARARIPVSAPAPALLVSERAIGTDQSQKFVLTVAADNTVAYRAVKLGGIVGGKRVIREGLNPGETIIVNGLQRVRPGMSVTPERQTAAADPVPSVAVAAEKVAALR